MKVQQTIFSDGEGSGGAGCQGKPPSFMLSQNYPTTTLEFDLPPRTMKVYNILREGQEVESTAGNLASGVYFGVMMRVPSSRQARRVRSIRKMLPVSEGWERAFT